MLPNSHISLVALSGFRVREPEMIALGMQLPGLAARAGAVAALPALGLLTLAAFTPGHWSTSYHDPAVVDDALIARILDEKPTLVAISALTASITEAYRLSETLRAHGVRTAIGGLHATACPGEAALHADAVVVGDGEPVWRDLLTDSESNTLRPLYRAPRTFDLADAPVPRFDLLGDKERPRFTLQTSRGCPLACEFCGASRLLGKFREKPVANVARELAAIKALDRRATIELADDNTFAGGRDAVDLLAQFERAGVRYFTEGDWRIGERPEVLSRLAASGCVQILVGIESLALRYRGMGAKGAQLSRVIDACERIQQHGVAVIACFILGAEGEDEESMGQLGEFLLDAPFADIQLTLQTPFPGTALRTRLQREGRLLPDRGWESCTLFDVTYRPDRMTPDALESAFRNLIRMVFAHGPTQRRMELRRAIWARRGLSAVPEAA
ncbi:Bacteriochlorophyllide d C-12(1)-methyltransferase [Phycisphaerales bacterium]|nr:Bacteriochlorophyllide d C-12(1)-methyltransferase [Phycisphaerales bacterium]